MKKALLGLVVSFIATFVLALSVDVHAVSLTLEGVGSSVSVGNSQALYASDSNGRAVLISAVGMPSPDGGKITELGVPSMMPDGRVVFGAEVTTKGEHGSTDRQQWTIFIGNPDASIDRRIAAIDVRAKPAWCNPVYHGDPYPVADADGQIAFMAALGRDRDGLLLFSHGVLSCLAESGSKTNEGDEIAVLSFGSPQMADDGQVIFNAWLKPSARHPIPKGDTSAHDHQHLQALLMATRAGIHELAVEGDYGPNHTEYMRPFGLPSAVGSPQGTLVAFTAKTPTGGALFTYDGRAMVRVLQTGTETPLGPVSYVSPGRPGLMSDGTMAVLAGCARVPVIFRLSRGLMDLRIQRGQLTPLGAIIESLGDPVLTASGAMFVGATDTDGREQLYVLGRNDEFFEVGSPEMLYRVAFDEESHPHTIFTGTLTVNQHGDFGYLGGK
ncbi:MAG TPA: hypothetical protein VKV03_02390 [Candidatus Binataceae bacterium]|nr:hypothetical protein [Candidatus Binataceae bacterium]